MWIDEWLNYSLPVGVQAGGRVSLRSATRSVSLSLSLIDHQTPAVQRGVWHAPRRGRSPACFSPRSDPTGAPLRTRGGRVR